mgnify:CR=1 FL=1
MKRTILLILTNILLCSITSAQDWILSKDGKDLQTYYRESDKSDIKELKIVTTIDAPAITVFELLNEIDLYDDWVYRTTEARLVETYSNKSLQYYAVVDFPWPFDDREMYILSDYKISEDKKYIKTNSIAIPREDIKDREDHVRIIDMELGWILKENDEEITEVVYVLRSDPGGAIPAWMVNLALEAGPTNTINGLRALVEDHMNNP